MFHSQRRPVTRVRDMLVGAHIALIAVYCLVSELCLVLYVHSKLSPASSVSNTDGFGSYRIPVV